MIECCLVLLETVGPKFQNFVKNLEKYKEDVSPRICLMIQNLEDESANGWTKNNNRDMETKKLIWRNKEIVTKLAEDIFTKAVTDPIFAEVSSNLCLFLHRYEQKINNHSSAPK